MAVEILVPKLGLTMTEGTINEWLVEPGAAIAVGDPLLNMATDKVDVEVEAEADGIFHPSVPAGASLPPGSVIGWLLEEGEEPPVQAGDGVQPSDRTALSVKTAASAETAAPVTAAVVANGTLGDGVPVSVTPTGRLMASPNARRVARENGVDIATLLGTGPGGRIVSEDVEAHVAERAVVSETVPPVDETSGTQAVTPLVRRLAAELGVDLADIVPTGPGGKVTRSDVMRSADALIPSTPATPTPRAAQQLTGLRGTIARNMMASLHEMAQLTLGHEADVTALAAARAALKAENAATGRRTPTISDFVVRAVAMALREHPAMNSTLRDGRIESNADINVGLAVSIDNGLVVPVLRHADRGSLVELSEQAASLASAARAGKLGLPQLEGATFAVTSLGTSGIDFFTPIINPGNVGILGVGRMRDGVAWEGDRPVQTRVMMLSLTFDHQAVDGAPAADYLMSVSELLARPLVLLSG